MAENPTDKPKLPGNHGQFGAGDATEAYKPLEDYSPPPAEGDPKQTDAEETA